VGVFLHELYGEHSQTGVIVGAGLALPKAAPL